jgi:hypothetical protein
MWRALPVGDVTKISKIDRPIAGSRFSFFNRGPRLLSNKTEHECSLFLGRREHCGLHRLADESTVGIRPHARKPNMRASRKSTLDYFNVVFYCIP